MMRRVLLLVVVATFCAAGVQAKKHKYDPFKVPRDQLVGQVKTVALRPMTGLTGDYAQADSVKAVFDSLLTAELTRAGFQVIPSRVFEQLHDEAVDSLGGPYDPRTGAPDTAKANRIHLWSLDQLKSRHQADALLHPRVITVTAPFSSGTAHWLGASQKLWKGTQGFFGILDKRTGTIPATALVVLIEDTEGNDLYVDSGGLSLAARVDGTRFEDLPADSLFGNPQRNSDAVRLALQALTRPDEK